MKKKASLLGLFNASPEEEEAYMVLLKRGVSGAAGLARDLGKPRQTTYSVLQSLVVKGLIEQGQGKYARKFSADPRKLPYLVEKKKEELNQQQKQIEKELPRLIALQGKNASYPKIQYYEGEAGLERLLEHQLVHLKSSDDKSFRGYGVNEFKEKMVEFLPEYVKRRAALGVQSKIFTADAPDYFSYDTAKKYKRTTKKLNMPPQEAGLYIAGPYIYLFSYRDNVGVMVENKAMAQLLQNIFDDHWDRVPK
jgi:sugar-specific transcriptional regulator TrmB